VSNTAPTGGEVSPPARLCLGTVQFGMRYGIANQVGRPEEQAVADILTVCRESGVRCFDTAEAYGESEAVLGTGLRRIGMADEAQVFTKGRITAAVPASLAEKAAASLSRLGRTSVSGWMLHDEAQLGDWDRGFADVASALTHAGTVGLFGVSCYHPDAALLAVESVGMELLQVPANPMDRRFLAPGVLSRLASSGAAVFVRSVYLQGLCLMEPAAVPDRIPHGQRAVKTLADFCGARGIARDHFCVHYVLHRTRSLGARLVIGVDTAAQLARSVELFSGPELPAECFDAWDSLWPADLEDLILPYRWPKAA
jgi:aryl-alcohol dehydrogenase-like predicted oxidoreductase